MGDLLGSPCVAPLFASFYINRCIFVSRRKSIILVLIIYILPLRSERNEIYIQLNCIRYQMRSYHHECNRSHLNSADKHVWARVVLGWVSSYEVLALHLFLRVFI